MNQKQLQYVSVLAQEGSFSKAAAILGISQPSLSQYIKRIETEAGQELFTRNGQFVRLTDAGQIYLDYGRKIIVLEREMNMHISETGAVDHATVVIGTTPYRSATVIPTFTKRLHEKYPGIIPIVREYPNCELADRLLNGEFDFCIAVGSVDTRIFNSDVIFNEKLVVAVPLTMSRFEGKTVLEATDLDGVPFVTVPDTQVIQKELDALTKEYGIKINTVATVKSLQAQIAMVHAGIGCALVPESIFTLCNDSKVKLLPLNQKLLDREIILVRNKNMPRTQISESVINAFFEMK